jgi:hypothetical protein
VDALSLLPYGRYQIINLNELVVVKPSFLCLGEAIYQSTLPLSGWMAAQES